MSQSFVVDPADDAGLTGTAAHTLVASAIQQEKQVEIKVVSVIKIIFDEKAGRRKIQTESFVLSVS